MQTRRNVLVAMMAAPVAVAVPAAACPSLDQAWGAALMAYEAAAEAHLVAANAHIEADELFDVEAPKRPSGYVTMQKDGRTFSPAEAVANFNAEQDAWRSAVESRRVECKVDELEAVSRDAARAEYAALIAMLECPAPNLPAVLKKMELATKYGCSTWELEPLVDDLRRIGGAA